MRKWRRVTIADVASQDQYALATGPFGSAISAKNFVDEGIPVIRGGNLSLDVGVRLKDDGLAFLTDAKAEKFKRSIARRGDLVFTCWGTVGQIGLIDDRSAYGEYVVSNKQMKLTPDPAKADSTFLYYLLSSPEMVRSVTGQAIGAAVPGFNLGQLKDLGLMLPPLEVQIRIAYVLNSIDDLIENNRRRVEVLEEMARTIYREWFVNFRYPGHEDVPLVDSTLGPIPEGWEVGRVDSLILLQRGFDLPLKDREPGHIPVIGASGINGSHLVPKAQGPGVTTGRSGTIGVVNYVPYDYWPLNTSLWVRDFRLATPRFAYFLLADLDLQRAASGAAVPTLDRKVVHGLPVVCPPASLIERWDTWVVPMFETLEALRAQSARITAIRDLLLPKLVTGQVDVSKLDLDGLLGEMVA